LRFSRKEQASVSLNCGQLEDRLSTEEADNGCEDFID
jgi:hypothetical protein